MKSFTVASGLFNLTFLFVAYLFGPVFLAYDLNHLNHLSHLTFQGRVLWSYQDASWYDWHILVGGWFLGRWATTIAIIIYVLVGVGALQ